MSSNYGTYTGALRSTLALISSFHLASAVVCAILVLDTRSHTNLYDDKLDANFKSTPYAPKRIKNANGEWEEAPSLKQRIGGKITHVGQIVRRHRSKEDPLDEKKDIENPGSPIIGNGIDRSGTQATGMTSTAVTHASDPERGVVEDEDEEAEVPQMSLWVALGLLVAVTVVSHFITWVMLYVSDAQLDGTRSSLLLLSSSLTVLMVSSKALL